MRSRPVPWCPSSPRPGGRGSRAFSLIELMVVVAIIAVLAAAAIPIFVRYIRQTKTIEAVQGVRKMAVAARAYLLEETAARGKTTTAPQFPETSPLTPAFQCCTLGGKCEPKASYWATPTWVALKFSLDDPHYYQYEFVSSGTGAEAAFSARAIGNLDCDDELSTFEMSGVFDGDDIVGSSGVFRKAPTE